MPQIPVDTAPARAAGNDQPVLRVLFITLATALVVPALSIVLHEFGHFTANAVFGYEPNQLTFASVRAGEPAAGVNAAFADGVSFAAGATVSLLLVGLAVLGGRVFGPNPLSLAVVMFECVRAAVGLVQQIANAGLSRTLTAGFGEIRFAARAVGGTAVPEVVLSWIELAVPILALIWFLRRSPRFGRVRNLIVTFGGLVAGVALWLGVVGPRVLPG